ncbi:MAG: hypothetical protein V1794_09485 [Candidatus Glassbacteria bacterium]
MDSPKTDSPSMLNVNDPSVLSAMKEMEGKNSKPHRTTLNLSGEATEILGNLSEELGLTQKEVFKDALNMAQKLYPSLKEILSSNKFFLPNSSKRIRRTYVLSQSLNSTLKKICSQHNISRDELLDRLLVFYNQLLNTVTDIRKQSYKKSSELISELLNKAEDIEGILGSMPLLNDDVLKERYSIIVTQLITLQTDIETYLEEGIEIEPW